MCCSIPAYRFKWRRENLVPLHVCPFFTWLELREGRVTECVNRFTGNDLTTTPLRVLCSFIKRHTQFAVSPTHYFHGWQKGKTGIRLTDNTVEGGRGRREQIPETRARLQPHNALWSESTLTPGTCANLTPADHNTNGGSLSC